MNEQALLIPCQGEQLLGILAPGTSDVAVLVVVGGPQYRAGSHRLFVQLCRHLATQGIGSLRFDVRGMGDSSGEQRSFEQLSDDIAAAIDALTQAAPHIQRVVLWGLCDGASAALLYCHERNDPRVAGLCLLNPWVRSVQTLAKTHVKHYYLQRLREPAFWKKLASGGVGGTAVRELWGNVRRATGAGVKAEPSFSDRSSADAGLPFPARMARGLQRRSAPTLLLLSENDYTAKEFTEHAAGDPAWQQTRRSLNAQYGRWRELELKAADHTLSQPAAKQAALEQTHRWLVSSLDPQSAPLGAPPSRL